MAPSKLELYIVDAATLKYSNDALRNLIGPLGAVKSKIEEETGLFIFQHVITSFTSKIAFVAHIFG